MQMQSWWTETDVQLGRLRWRQTSMFLKRMSRCCCKRICTWLWRFGLGPTDFCHFSPWGSEDPIPVRLSRMAEKPKLHKANFTISPTLDSTLPTEILCVYINLRSYSLNIPHLQELSSYTQLPGWGSKSITSEQPVHQGNLTTFSMLVASGGGVSSG